MQRQAHVTPTWTAGEVAAAIFVWCLLVVLIAVFVVRGTADHVLFKTRCQDACSVRGLDYQTYQGNSLCWCTLDANTRELVPAIVPACFAFERTPTAP